MTIVAVAVIAIVAPVPAIPVAIITVVAIVTAIPIVMPASPLVAGIAVIIVVITAVVIAMTAIAIMVENVREKIKSDYIIAVIPMAIGPVVSRVIEIISIDPTRSPSKAHFTPIAARLTSNDTDIASARDHVDHIIVDAGAVPDVEIDRYSCGRRVVVGIAVIAMIGEGGRGG